LDVYQDLAGQLEQAREVASMKDQKKVVEYSVPYFRFTPDATENVDATIVSAAITNGIEGCEEQAKKSRRKPKKADSFNLSQFYTMPLELFSRPAPQAVSDDDKSVALPWRGQFIPWMVDEKTQTSGPHLLKKCFSDIVSVPANKLKEGLFLATYTHPLLGAGEDVFFIPCTTGKNGLGARQAFFQCLLDELKPLFGVPCLGTHSLYLDHSFEKINKKADWGPDNFEIIADRGCHVVMFPTTALGLENREAVITALVASAASGGGAVDLQDFSVEALTVPFVKKAKAPFLTAEFSDIRHQVINIFMFYLCMGMSKGDLSRMLLLAPSTTSLVNLHRSENDDGENNGANDGAGDNDGGPDGTIMENLALAAQAKVVPFYELTAFTNRPFPETFKKIRQTLLRALLIGEQDHVMCRFFELMMHLDWNGIEIVLKRFGAPIAEWIGVIRTNLRDIRCGWLLWSQHSEANQLIQRQKNQEKNRTRLERKRTAKQPPQAQVVDEPDQKTQEVVKEPVVPKKRRTTTPKVTASDDDTKVEVRDPLIKDDVNDAVNQVEKGAAKVPSIRKVILKQPLIPAPAMPPVGTSGVIITKKPRIT
jgi:hypothetical protein